METAEAKELVRQEIKAEIAHLTWLDSLTDEDLSETNDGGLRARLAMLQSTRHNIDRLTRLLKDEGVIPKNLYNHR